MAEFASKGVAGAGLGTGIAGDDLSAVHQSQLTNNRPLRRFIFKRII